MDKFEIKRLLSTGRTIFDLPLRVAYYARVSTGTDGQLNSLANQTKYYEDVISENKNWTFAGGYVDEGISGCAVKKRGDFLRMIDDASKGRFDYILTKEISRFSRNTLDSIAYTRQLLGYGVGVYFQNDNIDTMQPDSELRLTIMASIAQDEVRKISERIRFGFGRAQENGVILGQDNMFGYRKSKGKLTVDEGEAETVRRIFTEYASGRIGLRRLSNLLSGEGIKSQSGGSFSYATLAGIIRNPKYKGYYAGRKYKSADYRDPKPVKRPEDEWILRRDESIPAIVTDELWDRANELLDRRGEKFKEKGDAFQNRYPYSGKLICGEHGTSYHRHVYKSKAGERECWNCRMYRLLGKKDGCDSPTLYTDELDEVMKRVYGEISVDRERIADELCGIYRKRLADASPESVLGGLDREAAHIAEKKDRLLELYTAGILSAKDYGTQNDALNKKLGEAEKKLEEKRKLSASARNNGENISDSALRGAIIKALDPETGAAGSYNGVLLDKITVTKESENSVRLDIALYCGVKMTAFKYPDHSISFSETGISQAQVSRLEKGALERIKKQM